MTQLKSPYTYETNTAAVVDNGTPPEVDAPDIKVVVTEERMRTLKVGVWRKAQRRDVDSIFSFLAHFMVNEQGRHMAPDDSFALLDELEMGEMEAAIDNIQTQMKDAAVPKA